MHRKGRPELLSPETSTPEGSVLESRLEKPYTDSEGRRSHDASRVAHTDMQADRAGANVRSQQPPRGQGNDPLQCHRHQDRWRQLLPAPAVLGLPTYRVAGRSETSQGRLAAAEPSWYLRQRTVGL